MLGAFPAEVSVESPTKLVVSWPDGSVLVGRYGTGPPTDRVELGDQAHRVIVDRLRGVRLVARGASLGRAGLPVPALLRGRRNGWDRSFEAALRVFVATIAGDHDVAPAPSDVETRRPGRPGPPGPGGQRAWLTQTARSLVPADLRERLVLRLLGGARAFVAETPEIADELAGSGLPAERVVTVPRGVDLHRFHPVDDVTRRRSARALVGRDSGVVAYCGRMDLRQKRVDLLLDAWEQADLQDWTLVLAGDGPDAARLVGRGRAMARPPVHLGWRRDTAAVLAAADIYVLPTALEATGYAMLEGMACGLPGLVSATTTYTGLRPEGVVLVDNCVPAWSGALVALASDPARRRQLGRDARAWVELHRDDRRQPDIVTGLLGDTWPQ